MPIEIRQIQPNSVPLEVEKIRPDLLRGSSPDVIQKQMIFHGKEEIEFGEFFSVSGNGDDQIHIWNGDFSGVHWIGAELADGEIRINGGCGRHLGSEMTGGSITVSENCSDWVGAEMTGGKIIIKGDAGHLVGAAYRGSPKGMQGGSILVSGKVGNEVGHTMRRGLIAVGDIGDLAGFNMLAGTILVFGEPGIRHGAGMRRGTIAFLGSSAPEMLPTFRYACRQQLTALDMVSKFLKSEDYPVITPSNVDLYHGDLLDGGRGEIMVAAS